MEKHRSWLTAAILYGVVAAPPAWGQTTLVILQNGLSGYTGTGDASIYEENDTFSNGGFNGIFVGRAGDNLPLPPQGAIRRGAIRFDLSSIPAGSMVLAVTLTLEIGGAPATGPAQTSQSLHPLLKDWNEGSVSAGSRGGASNPGDMTWRSNKAGQEDWVTPGGDFGPASAAATVGQSGKVGWASVPMAADVQAWIDNPSANFGWMLVGDESGTLRTARRFNSSEDLSSSRRPALSILLDQPSMNVESWDLY